MKLFFILFLFFGTFSCHENKVNCSSFKCDECIEKVECVWCSGLKKCEPFSEITDPKPLTNCSKDFCFGSHCSVVCQLPPPEKCSFLFPCTGKKWQIGGDLVLMILYGVVLAFAAKMISDGSEMLLVIFNPGIIGGFVLPVLGAVPDAAIVIFSGVGAEDAQTEIAVGMGTLAGSTIMLMTIPFSIGIVLAACDIKNGKQVEKKRTTLNPFKLGVTWGYDVPVNAAIAIVTSVSYFILQGIGFYYLAHKNDEKVIVNKKLEKWMAFGGMFVCIFCFIAFSIYQVLNTRFQTLITEKARKKHQMHEVVNQMKHLVSRTHSKRKINREREADPEGYTNRIALKWGRHWRQKTREAIAKREGKEVQTFGEKEDTPLLKKEEIHIEDEEEEEEEEYQNWPKWKILLKSLLLMGIGIGLVTFFSDPMVDIISDFGKLIGIRNFFVSFIITPICSNASELIASLIFASKKRIENNTIAFAQLYGAAIMNNTLCLGIFYLLVFLRELEWSFGAETLTIFISTVAVALVGLSTFFTKFTLRLWFAPIILSVYPLSLGLVCLLEYVLGWD